MIRMRLGFESAYEDSEVRDEALRAYLFLGRDEVEYLEVYVFGGFVLKWANGLSKVSEGFLSVLICFECEFIVMVGWFCLC